MLDMIKIREYKCNWVSEVAPKINVLLSTSLVNELHQEMFEISF